MSQSLSPCFLSIPTGIKTLLYETKAALLFRTIVFLYLLISFNIIVHNGAFNLFDQVGDGDTTRTGIGAVEDGAATPDAIALTQDGETLGPTLIAAIEDE